eukprot:6212952-Pleurochrysis_carterae.AAC.3
MSSLRLTEDKGSGSWKQCHAPVIGIPSRRDRQESERCVHGICEASAHSTNADPAVSMTMNDAFLCSRKRSPQVVKQYKDCLGEILLAQMTKHDRFYLITILDTVERFLRGAKIFILDCHRQSSTKPLSSSSIPLPQISPSLTHWFLKDDTDWHVECQRQSGSVYVWTHASSAR